MTDERAQVAAGQRFVGRTPREAIGKVRAALGRDAVILEQRQRDGQVEIVASRDFPPPRAAAGSAPEPAASGEPAAPAGLSQDGGSSQDPGRSDDRVRSDDRGRNPLREQLSLAGFEAGLLAGMSRQPDLTQLAATFHHYVRCASLPVPLTGAYRFVGPPGAGKTTTIVKLLAERVLRYGSRGLLVVSTDDRRLAGCEPLALAGELLEVPYVECHEAGLDELLAEHRDKSLVLVDSAGLSFGQGTLPPSSAADVLVVPAMWQAGALRRLYGRLGGLTCTGAVLSHVDQTDSLGPAFSVICEWDLPLIWISRGPELPDDLERATPELLTSLALGSVDRSGMRTTFSYGA